MKQRDVDDFIVESTPVLDIKKSNLSAGVQPAASGQWDADRTEVYADIDDSDVIATLTAENGECYPITTFPFVIGRGNECDLVLNGKGISRKHAEIIFQSGRFVVNDLESLNGLKVNGYKVARVILEENDQIKLGEISLLFSSGGAEADGSVSEKSSQKKSGLFSGKSKPSIDVASDDTFGPSPLKKAVTFVLIVMSLVLFAGVGYMYLSGANQNSLMVQNDLGGSQPHQVNSQPTAQVARSGNDSAIGSSSESFGSDKPAETVAPQDQPVAISSIAPPPSLSMAVPVSKPDSAKVEPAIKPDVKQLAAPAPAKVVPSNRNKDAERAIVDAKRFYVQGDGQKAIAEIKPYVGNKLVTGKTSDSVKDSYSNFTSLTDQYNQAQSAFNKGDKDMAFSLWTDFMSREEKLLGEKSAYSRSITSKVVDEYVARGNDASNRGEYHEAYKNWQKALNLGDSVAATIAIDNLNNRAKQLYRQALRLEYVNANKARAMWQEVTQLLPPGTEYHTKASAKLAWYEKWGA